MKAAVLREAGKLMQIEEVPDPTPAPGELILKVESCGICGSDLHVSDLPGAHAGRHGDGPRVLGGGRGGRARRRPARFRVGERVCAMPFIGCGQLRPLPGRRRHRSARRIQTHRPRPGARRLRGVRARRAARDAAPARRASTTARARWSSRSRWGCTRWRRRELAPGARVLVIGGGPIGLAVALWSRFFGARAVVMSEKAAGRRELAARFGATDAIDPAQRGRRRRRSRSAPAARPTWSSSASA